MIQKHFSGLNYLAVEGIRDAFHKKHYHQSNRPNIATIENFSRSQNPISVGFGSSELFGRPSERFDRRTAFGLICLSSRLQYGETRVKKDDAPAFTFRTITSSTSATVSF